jgi:glycosyltransferase involved in cell wall biosynthesis
MPFMVLNKVKQMRKGIVMSKFGQQMAKDMGLDVFYVPHSVETNVFKPIDRNSARARLSFPKDKFIVGMVAANKGAECRKSLFEQIAAFAGFHSVHKNSILYLHTDDGTHGGDVVDLVAYCKTMNLKTDYLKCNKDTVCDESIDVWFVDQYNYFLGIPDVYLVDIYNACDVTMLVSMGEGFGIPLIESQACGCPVITGDWTAMGELCFSGWKIPKEEAIQVWRPHFNAFQWRVKVEAVADRLFKVYEVKNNQDYRDRARKGAMAYDADKVCEKYWKPVLEEIEIMIQDNGGMKLVTF